MRVGTAEKSIIYRSAELLGATITGAELLTGWQLFKGTTWINRLSNEAFGGYNPYTTEAFGTGIFHPPYVTPAQYT